MIAELHPLLMLYFPGWNLLAWFLSQLSITMAMTLLEKQAIRTWTQEMFRIWGLVVCAFKDLREGRGTTVMGDWEMRVRRCHEKMGIQKVGPWTGGEKEEYNCEVQWKSPFIGTPHQLVYCLACAWTNSEEQSGRTQRSLDTPELHLLENLLPLSKICCV
jgi:hypothetical protein